MKVLNLKVDIDDKLLEGFEIEGVILQPTNPLNALLVLSLKNKLTLHIYKLLYSQEVGYYIEKLIYSRTFEHSLGMHYFLMFISTFKEKDFMEFIHMYENNERYPSLN
jgi:hypothetical protein